VKVYRHEELARFFAACSDLERVLFATFLLTGFREQEVMFLYWSDVNFELRTVRATAKPELGFYPKRWEDREVPAPADPAKFDLKTFRSTNATGMLRRGFDVRTDQHWMGHKSLETTMRYLALATDVHDEVDLVTIPSVGKAGPAPRKSAAREFRSSRKARPVQSR
jgi:integrase